MERNGIMRNDVLICEISGKRPGSLKERPTERFPTKYPHVIISNDSKDYETEWEIVNVPKDYQEWYINNIKSSDKAWYAPMSRSYAIKYARENGYKYCIQLDDNIKVLGIGYMIETENVIKRYSRQFSNAVIDEPILDDMIDMLCITLDNTNAGMAGMNLSAVMPTAQALSERYVYTFFALKLDSCPDVFQGDFEDDIEYRLKMAQMGIPAIQCCFLQYGKTGVGGGKDFKDVTGCRQAYKEAGVLRGEHMRKLYGDIYSAGTTDKGISTAQKMGDSPNRFKHKIKPFKLGVKVYDRDAINNTIKDLLVKYAKPVDDKVIYKEIKKK